LGSHVRCEKYFCKRPKLNDHNFIDDAKKSKFIDEISHLANRLVIHADSLLMNLDNNVCEQFNSIINKHLSGKPIDMFWIYKSSKTNTFIEININTMTLGKHINFSQRQSYSTRVEAAVVSYNTSGEFLRKLHKNVVNDISK